MSIRPMQAALLAGLMALAPPAIAHESPAAPVQQASLSPAARAAAATVDAFHAALRRGDTKAAAALVADDALIFEEGGAERSKAEYAASHLAADADFSSAVTSTVTRRIGHANGALAWIASEGRTSGTYKGRTLDRATVETMVLRRAGRSWRIVHIHWSSAS